MTDWHTMRRRLRSFDSSLLMYICIRDTVPQIIDEGYSNSTVSDEQLAWRATSHSPGFRLWYFVCLTIEFWPLYGPHRGLTMRILAVALISGSKRRAKWAQFTLFLGPMSVTFSALAHLRSGIRQLSSSLHWENSRALITNFGVLCIQPPIWVQANWWLLIHT